ncbi:MAG: endonuclease NucS domain-containing protein [Candidatus Kariarchaeaceae archaeon]
MASHPQFGAKRITFLNFDNFNDLSEELSNAFGKKMINIYGECQASFDGRIKSFIPWGHRVVILKKDGSFLMHSTEGVKPVNWQLPGAGEFTFSVEDGLLKIYTLRSKTKETMTTHFKTIHLIFLYDAYDHGTLAIYGSEADLVKYLTEHPELIDKTLQITQTEYETPVGFIDIRGVNNKGEIIIIEVKKRAATPEDGHQLKRYVESLEEKEGQKIRGYLVAPSFPNKVQIYLSENNLKAVEIPWEEIFPTITKPTTTLDDFFE